MCTHLWINEWTTRCKSKSWINWTYSCRIFQRWRRKGCVTLYWQHFQIHLSMFRSVSPFRTYSISCRISTYLSNRFRIIIRKNYNHKEGINYISLSYLCTCRRSHRSSTSNNICSLGCHHCVIKSPHWIRYLSSRRSTWFQFSYDGPKYRWWEVIWFSKLGTTQLLEECKSYFKITNHSRISLPFLVWMSCQKMTKWQSLELEKCRDSSLNHSSCLKCSLVERVNSYHLMIPLLDLEVIYDSKLALLDGEGDEYPENAFYM